MVGMLLLNLGGIDILLGFLKLSLQFGKLLFSTLDHKLYLLQFEVILSFTLTDLVLKGKGVLRINLLLL